MKKNFNEFTNTLKNSIKTWEYFVNWKKVFSNSSELEIILNKLNFLLGKEDIKKEFNLLFKSNPDIVKAFPILLAIREDDLEVYDSKQKTSEFFNFTKTNKSADEYYEFLLKSGLVELLKSKKIKNLVDYVVGVEVGLDSNGRKNRGGKLMESIVEVFVKEFSKQNNLEYISQATPKKIQNKWGVIVEVDKSARSFDFAVFNPKNNKIKLFETNFYNGGGSKLKAVCGEFKGLHDELKRQNIDFVWVTDGLGWDTTKRPLEEVYNHNEYVFNLSMLEKNVLKKLDW